MAQTISRQQFRRLAPTIGIFSALFLAAYLFPSTPALQVDASPLTPLLEAHFDSSTDHFGDFRPPDASFEVDQAIRQAAARYNLPRWFYYAIVERESSFDPDSVGPYGEPGLTQLNGSNHLGTPYPNYLDTPNDWDMGYYYDMNFSGFGRWIKMSQVSPLTDPFDPHQNLARFSSGFAVPAFYLFRQVYGLDDAEALRAVAYHWNKGLFRDYDPNNWDYLALYDRYVERYRWTVEAQDGGWDGQPKLPWPP